MLGESFAFATRKEMQAYSKNHYLPQYEPIPQGVVRVYKQLAAPAYVGSPGYLRNDGLVWTKFRDLDDLPSEAGS